LPSIERLIGPCIGSLGKLFTESLTSNESIRHSILRFHDLSLISVVNINLRIIYSFPTFLLLCLEMSCRRWRLYCITLIKQVALNWKLSRITHLRPVTRQFDYQNQEISRKYFIKRIFSGRKSTYILSEHCIAYHWSTRFPLNNLLYCNDASACQQGHSCHRFPIASLWTLTWFVTFDKVVHALCYSYFSWMISTVSRHILISFWKRMCSISLKFDVE
jgi:hypothetical protein